MKQGVDHASIEALKRTWNVLQVIWTEYLASSKTNTFDILRVSLAVKSGETVHSLPNILNGLKLEGYFDYHEGAKNYAFSNINHKKLEALYLETKNNSSLALGPEELYGVSDNNPPFFDPAKYSICFKGREIPIPRDSDQEGVCKVVLKDKFSMSKEWIWDEIFEKWGDDDPEPALWRKIYNAARTINTKVATKTTIDDLLIITTKTISVNPKYLKH